MRFQCIQIRDVAFQRRHRRCGTLRQRLDQVLKVHVCRSFILELDLGLLVDENRSAKHCLVVTRRPTPTIDDSVKDEHRAPSSGLSATFSPCERAKGRL